MKFRNKKTGYVGDFDIKSIKDGGEFIRVMDSNAPPSKIKIKCGTLYYYDTLAELCKEWEDYKPAEPLIKDEKIRKAVRAWWEAVSGAMPDKRILYKKSQDFAVGIYTISCGAIYLEVLEEGKMYTIEELCGEEEE